MFDLRWRTIFAFCLLFAHGMLGGGTLSAGGTPNEIEGIRLRFADTVRFGPINVGMWAKVTVVDLDGDGGQDLLVAGGGYESGVYLFRDTGLKDGWRVYSVGREASVDRVEFRAVALYGEERSGLLYVRNGVLTYRPPTSDLNILFGPPEPVKGQDLKPFRPGGDQVYPVARGDRIDLLIGREEGDYWPSGESPWGDRAKESGVGLFKSWDKDGNWRGGAMRGILYLARDVGSGKHHLYATPFRLRAQSGEPLQVYGHPSAVVADWDRDGDWDIICADFIDYLTYFENVGTVENPVFRAGRKVQDTQGNVIHLPQNISVAERIDWRGAGRQDIIVGQEDGRVYVLQFRGLSCLPLFTQPAVVLQEQPRLETGIMAVPSAVDWDRDGKIDLLAGNGAGYVEWFRNLGTNAEPVFDLPKRLESDGFPLRVQAGYRGSVQGPNEKKWGYTCPCITDWDGDGYLDIILCGIRGDHIFYRNSRGDILRELEQGRPLTVNGIPLQTRWRVRPVAVELERGELPSYVCLDAEGYLVLHERDISKGVTELKPGHRLLYRDGAAMKMDGEGGHEGRAKPAVVDWDNDGDWDLLCGVKGNQPLARPGGPNSKILFFENVGMRRQPVFARPRYLIDRKTDKPFEFGDHSCAPFAVALFGDSVPGLLVGVEGGGIYYWSRPTFGIGSKKVHVNDGK